MSANPGGGDYRPDEPKPQLCVDGCVFCSATIDCVAQDAPDTTETPARTPGGSGTAEARTEAQGDMVLGYLDRLRAMGPSARMSVDIDAAEVEVRARRAMTAQILDMVADSPGISATRLIDKVTSDRRVARHQVAAEIAHMLTWGQVILDGAQKLWPIHPTENRKGFDAERETATDPGMTNLEAELVALRAEVEQLQAITKAQGKNVSWMSYHDACAGRDAAGRRAVRAEARLTRVEALTEKWDKEPYPRTGDPGWNEGYDVALGLATDEVRAALAEPLVCDCCDGNDAHDGWVWGGDGKPWCSECYRSAEATE